jgi:hypothetical protein
VPATGMWNREMEESEAIYVFDTTLENVLSFAHHYAITFDQEAVFVQVFNTHTYLFLNPTKKEVNNDSQK